MITFIGLIAGTLGVISFIPQVIKIIKTKHTQDLSLPMWIILSTAVLLWVVYGVLIQDLPVIITNVIIFILTLSVVILKIRYR